MKKTVFVIVTFITLGVVKLCHAAFNSGTFLYRTSYTESSDTNVLISSEGVIAFGGVMIASPTVFGGGGTVFVYNAQQFAGASTIAAIDCGAGTAGVGGPFVPVQCSSGLMYTKSGSCRAAIYWDVLIRNPLVKPVRVN